MKRLIVSLAIALSVYLVIFTIIIMVLLPLETEKQDIDFATFFYYYSVLKVSDRPLFRADGGINHDVLENLMMILNDPRLDPMLREEKAYWPTGMAFDGVSYTAITAADFSDFVVPKPCCMSQSGAILIKLFEIVPGRNGVPNGHLTEFTSQWWQLVYRSTDGVNDVLTLWMTQPYRLSHFSGTRYDNPLGRTDERFFDFVNGEVKYIPVSAYNTIRSDERIVSSLPTCDTYFFEGNYSVGVVRSNLLRDFKFLLKHFDIERYLIAPKELPGRWQSSHFQTGTNAEMKFYVSGQFYSYLENYSGATNPSDGLGAAGMIWGHHLHFNIMNGKDGLSTGPHYGHWPHTTVVPTYNDLIWLPSDFEVRSMGHNKDNALFQTFVENVRNPNSRLRWNYRGYRKDDWRYSLDTSGGRSGLWRLNGFDRAFDDNALGFSASWEGRLAWLRSADSLGIGNANTVYRTGNRYGYGVNQLAGLRPGVHLSVTQLLEMLS